MEQYFRVGVITSAHGIRGGVKVFPVTDDPGRFKDIKEVLYSKPNSDVIVGSYKLRRVAFQNNMVLLEFDGVNDRNQAELLKNQQLWVSRENALPLAENEYYMADVIGMKVVSDEGEELGTVTDIIETGSNDVFQVEMPGGKELLIPSIPDCVVDIDLEKDILTVHLLPGLRDL